MSERVPSELVAAAFHALPSSIAVLDSDGTILTVNRSWHRFADENGLGWSHYGVGCNYLEVADQAAEDPAEGAGDVAAGIRAVLEGRREEYSVVYPCHSPNHERWFRLHASRLGHGDAAQVVVCHVEITQQIIAESKLQASLHLDEERFEALLRLGRQRHLAAQELTGFALEEAVRLTRSEVGYFHLVDEARAEIALNTWTEKVHEQCTAQSDPHYPLEQAGVWADCIRQKRPVVHNDYQELTERRGYPDGHTQIVRHMGIPIIDGNAVVAVAGVGNKAEPYDQGDVRQLQLFMNNLWDMLQHRQVEEELRQTNDTLEDRVRERTEDLERANRALQDIAEGVSAAVGQEFFQSLVQHLASSLNVAFAFVARLGMTDRNKVETLALAVHQEIVDNMFYELTGTPCEAATERGLCFYSRGIQQLFPEDHLLAEMGAESYAGIPLHASDGDVLGILVVLDIEPLDDRAQLVRSILQVFAARAAAELERLRAEEELKRREHRYELATSAGQVGVWDWNLETDEIFIEPKLKAMLGFRDDEISNQLADWGKLVHPEDAETVMTSARDHIEGRSPVFETAHRMLHKDGSIRWMLARGSVVPGRNDHPRRMLGTDTDITDRRRAEQTITEQNRFLNHVIESLTHPFYVVNTDDHTITMSNSAAGGHALDDRMTCYQASYGRDTPCDGHEHPCPLEEVKRTGRPVMMEHTHVDISGRVRHVEIHGYPLVDNSGRVSQMIEYALDVTARHRAEQQLKRRNRELTMLNWIIAAGVADLNLDSVLEAACREIALNFELPVVFASLISDDELELEVVGEFVTVGLPSLVGHKTPVTEFQIITELRTNRQAVVVEDVSQDSRLDALHGELKRRDAKSVMVVPLIVEEEVAGLLWLEHHRLHHFSHEEVNLAMTVAGQIGSTMAKLRLSGTRSRLQAAIQQTDDMVLITDAAGAIQYVNPAFERTTGFTAAEATGKTTAILSSPSDDPELRQQRARAILAGAPWRGRIVRHNKTGRDFIEECAITPIRDATGRIVNFVSVGRDVTEAVRLEHQYRQAQKLESIGRLAGGVAHDFNNLLAAIIGYAELALRTLEEEHEIYGDLQEIRDTAQRAAELTGQLLTFARRQSVEPRQLNLNELIPTIERMLRRIIGEHIELVTHASPDLGTVLADRALMEQVVVNLAVNARDAMPDGGRLVIETSNFDVGDDPDRELPSVEAGSYVRLRVRDSGYGIDPEVMEHLFEPFVSTKEAGHGTGLGLAICFGIVSQFGGRIWADSTRETGTTMSVILPRCDQEATAEDCANIERRVLPRGTETILLVEDEENLRKLLSRILTDCGYAVLVAANGQEGLELARTAIKDVDLLVTDVVMPKLGGVDLAGLLRALSPHLPIVFMSGYTGKLSFHQQLLDDNTAFLQKPFTPEHFARELRRVLDAAADHDAG